MPNPSDGTSPSQLARIRELFDRAQSVPAAQREAFVRRQGVGDDAVRDRVLSLLHAGNLDTADMAAVLRSGPSQDQSRTAADPTGTPGDKVHATATDELLAKLAKAAKLDRERFAVESEVGKGGMGAVFRVHDRHLNRRLALKVLLESGSSQEAAGPGRAHQLLGRFLEEAQVSSQLDHPGVVPVHELGLDHEGKVWFTMRLVKGRTASEVFSDAHGQRDGWSLTRALEVILKVCDTMAYAHEKGVLHRDLKPSNVMVGRFGEVYVMDWGLAKVVGQPDRHDVRIRPETAPTASKLDTARKRDAEHDTGSSVVTMDGAKLGTPSYMPPEQARGEVATLDVRADVYAIGAMVYELVTGRAPYVVPGVRKPAYRILDDVADGPPKAIEEIQKGVPAELVAIVRKAMARDREERYADTAALAADVRAFLGSQVVKAYRTGALVELKLWVRRNRSLAASLLAGVLILVVGVIGMTWLANENANLAQQKAKLLGAEQKAKDDAQRNEERAVAGERLAIQKAAEAERSARVARQQQYGAAMSAANAALAQAQPLALRQHVHAAPMEFRDIEWHILDSLSDSSDYLIEPPPDQSVFGCRALASDTQGKRLALGYTDGSVHVWDLQRRQWAHHENLQSGDVRALAFSHDGKMLTAGSTSGAISVLRFEGTTAFQTLQGHTACVHDLDFSSDDTRLISASEDSTAILWDVAALKPLVTLRHGDDALYAAAFDPWTHHVAIAGGQGVVSLWSQDGHMLESLPSGPGIGSLAFVGQAHSCILVSGAGDGSVTARDSRSLQQVWTRKSHTGPVSLQATSSTLEFASACNGGLIWLWRADVWDRPIRFLNGGGTAGLVTAWESGIAGTCDGGKVRVWDTTDVTNGDLEAQAYVFRFAVHPKDGRVFAACGDGAVQQLEPHAHPSSGSPPSIFSRRNSPCVEIAIDERGAFLAAGYEDGAYSVHALDDKRSILSEPPGNARVEACQLFYMGRDPCLLIGLGTGVVNLWSLSTNRVVRTWQVPAPLCALAVSEHAQVAAIGSGGAIIMADLVSGSTQVHEGAHADVISGVSFGPEGAKLATCAFDGHVKMWQVEGLSLTSSWDVASQKPKIDVAFASGSSNRLVSGGFDNTVALHDCHDGSIRLLLEAEADTRCVCVDDRGRLWATVRHGGIATWPAQRDR